MWTLVTTCQLIFSEPQDGNTSNTTETTYDCTLPVPTNDDNSTASRHEIQRPLSAVEKNASHTATPLIRSAVFQRSRNHQESDINTGGDELASAGNEKTVPMLRRSNRIRKPPSRFGDYIMYK